MKKLQLKSKGAALTFAFLLVSNHLAAADIKRTTEGALELENVPAAEANDANAMRPYLESRSGVVFGWLPHGDGALIGTRFGDTQQLHSVRAPMGARTQLTFEQEPILSAIINHNTAAPAMIYARDTGGDEQFQLYGYDFLLNKTALLTEGGGTRNERPAFAPYGLQFAVGFLSPTTMRPTWSACTFALATLCHP